MKAMRGFLVCFLVYALCGQTTGAAALADPKTADDPKTAAGLKTFESNATIVTTKPDAATLKPADAPTQKPTDAPAQKPDAVPGQKPSEVLPTLLPSQTPSAVSNNTTPANATVKPTPEASSTIVPSSAIPTKPTPTSVPINTVPATNTSSTTVAPATTNKPAISTVQPLVPPTNTPRSRFDGPSFVGGIVLTFGLVAMGFIGFKYYKARTDRNYHTL